MYDYNNNCILCMVFSHPAYLIVYYHHAYLIYMQSTFMLSWMKDSWNQDCQEKYQ